MPLNRRGVPPALVLCLVLLSGCPTKGTMVSDEYPNAELTETILDFGTLSQGSSLERMLWLENQGGMVMGVDSITLGNEQEAPSFLIRYSVDEIECPGAVPDETGAPAGDGLLGPVPGMDTGSGKETGEQTDTGADDTGSPDSGPVLMLEPGCRLPLYVTFAPQVVGTTWGSVVVTTDTEQVAEEAAAEPVYYSDPINNRQVVLLKGVGQQGVADLEITPRSYDFGRVWIGYSSIGYVAIRNMGDGPVHLDPPALADTCHEGFEILNQTNGFQQDLEGGQATYLELQYTPIDIDPAFCDVLLTSDDPRVPEVEVSLGANASVDPDNHYPTVFIRSPGIGYQHETREAIEMEINIFDVDQPASTLYCRVKSMIQLSGATVANCTPEDDSGHSIVSIDLEKMNLDPGIDTLRVQVTDASEVIAYASTTVLINAPYPESDDDGDGWGEVVDEDGYYDCDDANPDTYPNAAELPDGEDNDCDGVADEITVAYDDDGDTFTEDEGDCNDTIATIYPGAAEIPDSADNDCNGVIDDRTTLYDDDGDGYTEMQLDCDDRNPLVHPGVSEICEDLVDNDCNGLIDQADACVDLKTKPYIVGGINLQQTACESGDQITASVFAYDIDGDQLDYNWQAAEGLTISPLSGSSTVTITCPEITSEGGIYEIIVNVSDGTNQAWDFGAMAVYKKGDLYQNYQRIVYSPKACAAAPAGGGLLISLAGMALGVAALRRRRS